MLIFSFIPSPPPPIARSIHIYDVEFPSRRPPTPVQHHRTPDPPMAGASKIFIVPERQLLSHNFVQLLGFQCQCFAQLPTPFSLRKLRRILPPCSVPLPLFFICSIATPGLR